MSWAQARPICNSSLEYEDWASQPGYECDLPASGQLNSHPDIVVDFHGGVVHCNGLVFDAQLWTNATFVNGTFDSCVGGIAHFSSGSVVMRNMRFQNLTDPSSEIPFLLTGPTCSLELVDCVVDGFIGLDTSLFGNEGHISLINSSFLGVSIASTTPTGNLVNLDLGGSLTMDGCLVDQATLTLAGKGLIYATGPMVISNSVFRNISVTTAAEISGGVVSAGAGPLVIQSCEFEHCSLAGTTSQQQGAAVASSGGPVTIADTLFNSISLSATTGNVFGGAVSLNGGDVEVIRCRFLSTQSRSTFGTGGALRYLGGGRTTVRDSYFYNSSLTSVTNFVSGGSIRIVMNNASATAVLRNLTVERSTLKSGAGQYCYGAGLYITGGAINAFILADSRFIDCNAGSSGLCNYLF